jgi:hypothetical protein
MQLGRQHLETVCAGQCLTHGGNSLSFNGG